MTWSIRVVLFDELYEIPTDRISISNDGLITITNLMTFFSVAVIATCGEVEGRTTITLSREPSTVTRIEAEDFTVYVPESGSKYYNLADKAKAYDQYGFEMPSSNINWTGAGDIADLILHTSGNTNRIEVRSTVSAPDTAVFQAYCGNVYDNCTVSIIRKTESVPNITWPVVTEKTAPTYGDTWSEIITLTGGSATLNGENVEGSFTVVGTDSSLKPSAGVQTYKILFTSSDGSLNIYREEEGSVTVAKANVPVPTGETLTYNGSGQNGVEAMPQFYTLSEWYFKKDAGEYTVTATLNDPDNYNWADGSETAEREVKFTIEPADYAVTINVLDSAIDLGSSDLSLLPGCTTTGVSSERPTGTLTFYEDAEYKTEVTDEWLSQLSIGEHPLYWSFTTDNPNYVSTAKYGTVTVTVEGDWNKVSIEGIEDVTYDGRAHAPDLVVKYDGKTLTAGVDFECSYKDNTNAGTATVTLTGIGDYAGKVVKTFTINKADRSIEPPVPESITAGSVTLKAAQVSDGNVEYAVSDTDAAPETGWQDSVTFTGLEDGKTYYFFVRVTGAANYNDAVSAGAAVRVDAKAAIITFDARGGSVYPKTAQTVDGKLETLPMPTRRGYTFMGWYTADGERVTKATVFTESCTIRARWRVNAAAPVRYGIYVSESANGEVTLSRRWAPAGTAVELKATPDAGYVLISLSVRDSAGRLIEVADGRFIMPASDVTVEAVFGRSGLPFDDVFKGAWYYDAVWYAYTHGLMNGVTDTLFDPDGTLTRAMLVTVLWRMEGAPASPGRAAFVDVQDGSWYAKAVAWAAAEGIVEGRGAGVFDPEAAVTRQETAAILYRLAVSKGCDVGVTGSLTGYADYAEVGDWAARAMLWATVTGLIEGDGGALRPAASCTRAEAAALLMRFCGTIL